MGAARAIDSARHSALGGGAAHRQRAVLGVAQWLRLGIWALSAPGVRPVANGVWYFRQWRLGLDSTWAHIHTWLRVLARLHAGRDPTPSAAIIDSQSVKTLMGRDARV